MNWKMSGQILVQGLKEAKVLEYVTRMKAYGTQIVAGVSPGQGGYTLKEIPIFDLVEEAIAALGEIQTSLIFVHPYDVLDAAYEAIAAGIRQIIIFSAQIPPLDTVRLLRKAKSTDTLILGPGSGGILIPEKFCLGTFEPQFYTPGKVALISDSQILTYEVALSFKKAGLGESMIVSLGIDNILGTTFEDWLKIIKENQETEAIVLILKSERIDQKIITYITNNINQPVIIYLYNISTNKHSLLKNALNIMTNQLSYSFPPTEKEETLKDVLNNSDILLANYPTQIIQLLQKS